MITTPHFHSRAQQQAMLGCAANLDPTKHPRRYAKLQARQRVEKEARWLIRDESASGTEYARQQLQAKMKAHREKQAERLRPIAATGCTVAEMARQLSSTRRTILNLLAEFAITRGPQTDLEE